jgi:hypothetical protein
MKENESWTGRDNDCGSNGNQSMEEKGQKKRGHRTKNILNLEENSQSCIPRKGQKLLSTPFMIEGRGCQDIIEVVLPAV